MAVLEPGRSIPVSRRAVPRLRRAIEALEDTTPNSGNGDVTLPPR